MQWFLRMSAGNKLNEPLDYATTLIKKKKSKFMFFQGLHFHRLACQQSINLPGHGNFRASQQLCNIFYKKDELIKPIFRYLFKLYKILVGIKHFSYIVTTNC